MINIIDGKLIAQEIKNDLKSRCDKLKELRVYPKIAVIQIGDNDSSSIYIRNKSKACKEIGISFENIYLPTSICYSDLALIVDNLNKNELVTGIIIQQPIPYHLRDITYLIDKEKDVDGFTPINIGKLTIGQECFIPCTPYGIMRIFEKYDIDLVGKHVVILGRSNIVGKPLIQCCLEKDATVTSCNSYTQNLQEYTKTADILISAIGKAKFINSNFISEKCECVIDVGMNRDENNKLCGDCDFDSIINFWNKLEIYSKDKYRYITPVPGGVGQMTVAMLMTNVIEVAERKINGKNN